jgi:hypothetical protein
MNDNPGRVGATVVGIFVIVVVFFVFLSPGHQPTTSAPAAGAGHVAGQRRFRGQGNRSLGRIVVAVTSQAAFDCPRCAEIGFAITSTNPRNPADGLNDATPSGSSAQFTVSPGTYSAVRVKTGDNPWTLTITPEPGG